MEGKISWEKALPEIEKGLKELNATARDQIMESLRADLLAPQLEDGGLFVGVTEFAEEPEVEVNFGGRDWQFSATTGELLGCGTFLGWRDEG